MFLRSPYFLSPISTVRSCDGPSGGVETGLADCSGCFRTSEEASAPAASSPPAPHWPTAPLDLLHVQQRCDSPQASLAAAPGPSQATVKESRSGGPDLGWDEGVAKGRRGGGEGATRRHQAELPPLLTCTPRRVFVTVKMSCFLADAPPKEQRGGVIIGAGMSALIANQCLKEGLYSREERQVVDGLFFLSLC